MPRGIVIDLLPVNVHIINRIFLLLIRNDIFHIVI